MRQTHNPTSMEQTGGVIPKKDTVTSLAAIKLRRPTALQECFMAFAPLRESKARPFMSEGGEGLNLFMSNLPC